MKKNRSQILFYVPKEVAFFIAVIIFLLGVYFGMKLKEESAVYAAEQFAAKK